MPIYLKKELMGFKDKRLAAFNGFKPSSKIFFTDRSKAAFLLWIICGFVSFT